MKNGLFTTISIEKDLEQARWTSANI